MSYHNWPSLERLEVLQGDITTFHVEAIVNAANTTLLGGGGVDGAIHRASGPELLQECRRLGGCATGKAKITRGYNLPAQWVIHTVGPVWHGGSQGEEALLGSCYQNSLALARRYTLKTVAFPSISTGAYCFPLQLAAPIALSQIVGALKDSSLPEKIFIVCFDKPTLQVYREALTAFSSF